MNVIKGEIVAEKTERAPRKRQPRNDSLERLGGIYGEVVRSLKLDPSAIAEERDITAEERACAALGHVYVGCGKTAMCSPRETDEDGEPIEPSMIEHNELLRENPALVDYVKLMA